MDPRSTRLDAVHIAIHMLKVRLGAAALIAVVGACSTFDASQGTERVNPIQSGIATTVAVESDTTETTRAPESVPDDVKQFVGFWMIQSVSGAEDSDLSSNLENGYLSFKGSTGVLSVILFQGTCAVFAAEVSVSDNSLKVQREHALTLIGCTPKGPVPILKAITECLRAGCLFEFVYQQQLRLFLTGGIKTELMCHPGAGCPGIPVALTTST